ncbi:hypothetical protein [Burkholderia anthina]|uniref:hypothetical protein n=1 Tax=Burkholderia anthina TaxID=179879 RepID=UPI001AA06AFD|nr:hypothetical protein [Burkholderia anthina]QTD91693.1 hypothetical protein J4G50_05170 [Burkholderia anthina]
MTPDNSRADALTDRIKAMFVPNPSDELGPTDEPESQYRFGYNTAIEDVLSVLAESPSSQPAAAPIAYDGLTEEFTDEVARLAGDAPGIREAVWAALENCNAIIAPQGNAAPSPADERAVCTHQWTWADGKCADCGARTQQPTPTGGMTLGERIAHVGGRVTDGGTVEFGSAMALDALVQHVLRDTRAAASPAAEAVAWVRKHPDTGALSGDWLWNDAIEQCRKDSGVWFPLGFLAAPQPAQADARVGLTDEQRKALQRAIDHAVMSDREDEEEALRALLAAHPGQPEPRTEVTDDKAAQLIKTLSDIIHDQTVAMQSAIIEWQHGNGAEAGLRWIVNTLEGPGNFPDFDAPYGKHAQFWFNANQAHPMPTCFCGNPSSSAWMGQGFCCEAHYREARAKYDAARAGGAS